MQSTSSISRRRIRTRLWMLVVLGLLFSLALQFSGVNVFRQQCCMVQTGDRSSALPSNRDRAQQAPTRHWQGVMAVPVSFDASDMTIPAGSERIFSHRQIDEFLRHEIQGNAGVGEPRPPMDEVQTF